MCVHTLEYPVYVVLNLVLNLVQACRLRITTTKSETTTSINTQPAMTEPQGSPGGRLLYSVLDDYEVELGPYTVAQLGQLLASAAITPQTWVMALDGTAEYYELWKW